MDRLRRIAGMGKAKAPVVVQEEKDESVVFFRELHKREKDRDTNLLEPMYSVEFDSIQGGHASKAPSGKRAFLIPVDEKHDCDWLKSTPATPLFPSIDMEAGSSQMVIQKDPLIPPRQVKPSTSRVSGRPEATKTSARPATPVANASSNKTFVKAIPPATTTKGKNQPHASDKRPSHKVSTNGQPKAAAASSAPKSSGAPKKHSERCYASQGGSTSAAKGAAEQDFLFRTPKNLITSGSVFGRRVPPATTEKARTKDPVLGADVVKRENGSARRLPLPPAAAKGVKKEQQVEGGQNVLPPRGRRMLGATKGTSMLGATKGPRTTYGKKEPRPELGIQAK